MALLYRAQLTPTKLQLIEGWVPGQPWFEEVSGSGFTNVGSFRFDDPDGEVGVETLLVRTVDGILFQVPVTYRGAPLEGAEEWLIGTTEHSVLGLRWVYDGLGDPVYLAAVTAAITGGGKQAEQWVDHDGELVLREPNAVVRGSGSAGVSPDSARVVVNRRPGDQVIDSGMGQLVGTWTGQLDPVVLVALS